MVQLVYGLYLIARVVTSDSCAEHDCECGWVIGWWAVGVVVVCVACHEMVEYLLAVDFVVV